MPRRRRIRHRIQNLPEYAVDHIHDNMQHLDDMMGRHRHNNMLRYLPVAEPRMRHADMMEHNHGNEGRVDELRRIFQKCFDLLVMT